MVSKECTAHTNVKRRKENLSCSTEDFNRFKSDLAIHYDYKVLCHSSGWPIVQMRPFRYVEMRRKPDQMNMHLKVKNHKTNNMHKRKPQSYTLFRLCVCVAARHTLYSFSLSLVSFSCCCFVLIAWQLFLIVQLVAPDHSAIHTVFSNQSLIDSVRTMSILIL